VVGDELEGLDGGDSDEGQREGEHHDVLLSVSVAARLDYSSSQVRGHAQAWRHRLNSREIS
jgi:hypothetical protein